jgi:hypothetical protein
VHATLFACPPSFGISFSFFSFIGSPFIVNELAISAFCFYFLRNKLVRRAVTLAPDLR